MNRNGTIDSKLSLDERRAAGDSWPMSLYPFHLYCQRIDAARNMARYYALAIEPTLFGEAAVVRRWGRIGSLGGEKSEVFATEREAAKHFLDLARRKRQKGYRPVGTSAGSGVPGASSA